MSNAAREEVATAPLPPMMAKILSTRQADCSSLSDAAIAAILNEFQHDQASTATAATGATLRTKLDQVLESVLRNAISQSNDASQRRASCMTAQKILKAIDDAVRSAKNRATAEDATRARSATETYQSTGQTNDNPQTRRQEPLLPAVAIDFRQMDRHQQRPHLPTTNGHGNGSRDIELSSRKRRWGEPMDHSSLPASGNDNDNDRERSDPNKRARPWDLQSDYLESNSHASSIEQQGTAETNVHPVMLSLNTALKASRKTSPRNSQPELTGGTQTVESQHTSSRRSAGANPLNSERRHSLPLIHHHGEAKRVSTSDSQNEWQRSTSQGSPTSSTRSSVSPEKFSGNMPGQQRRGSASAQSMTTRWEPPSRSLAQGADGSSESSDNPGLGRSDQQLNQSSHNMAGRPTRAMINDVAGDQSTGRNTYPDSSHEYRSSRANHPSGANPRDRDRLHENLPLDRRGHGSVETKRNTNSSGPHSASQQDIFARNDSITRTIQSQSMEAGQVLMNVGADCEMEGTRCYYTGALRKRPPMDLTFVQAPITEPSIRHVVRRMNRWDPYWQFEYQAQIGRTFTGVTCKSTGSGASPDDVRTDFEESSPIKTAMRVHIRPDRDLWTHENHSCDSHLGKPARQTFIDGDKAILLRMVPVKEETNSRADCHLWPRGCFLQIDGKPVYIQQRKQSQEGKWEGNCKALDLSPFFKSASSGMRIEMCCYDDEPYYFCLAVCKYRTPSTVFQDIMHPSRGIRMARQPRKVCIERAKQHIKTSTVTLDDDNDICADARFAFSLVCPISKQIIKDPVRGIRCTHWQCFDLAVFLESNATEGRQRWRCGVCDNFIPVESFEYCRLTRDMLDEFKDELTTTRDRVEFRSDGTYELLPERQVGNKQQRKELSSARAVPSTGSQRNDRPHSAVVLLDQNVIVL